MLTFSGDRLVLAAVADVEDTSWTTKEAAVSAICSKTYEIADDDYQGIAMQREFARTVIPLIDHAVAKGYFKSQDEALQSRLIRAAVEYLYEQSQKTLAHESGDFKKKYLK